ncbi:MAG: hypothetical protein EX266_05280 [Rhodobacteraceae bacterium]|nr:MAG: hypothetical protein EX266_05280 [Paracoccaceae bacterium]
MIGTVGNQSAVAQGSEARGAGKRADAVGQQAKAAVAVAREAGQTLPSNAQGLAASAVARGIDPATLFAARVTELDGSDAATVDDVPVTPDVVETEGEDVPVSDASVLHEGTAEKSVDYGEIVISEDPSLALLLTERDDTGSAV